MEYGVLDGVPALTINISKRALDYNETKELLNELGLSQSKDRFVFTAQFAKNMEGMVRVETRSLLGAMFYLSQSVEVPLKDREMGKVTLTKTSSGENFDWQRLTADLIHVQSNNSHPSQNAVAIKYRGSWFYIDDADLTSKSTFSMLGQIFSLQAGKSKSTAPVLTLPVGQ